VTALAGAEKLAITANAEMAVHSLADNVFIWFGVG